MGKESCKEIPKPGSFTILCGAGVSKNSGLPLATELREYILGNLLSDKQDVSTLAQGELPFEAFLQAIEDKSDISRILDIFTYGTPNTNHIFIARLARAGLLRTIYTTNFDLLLERALENEGLVKGEHFRVYSSEGDFSLINPDNTNTISVIKIHGSIDNKESVRVTLRSVARKSLSDKRMKAVTHMFLNNMGEPYRKLVILGYSCSDYFDIVPQIHTLKDNLKEILLVEHSEKESIENIGANNNRNPFRHYRGKRIRCDTDTFIETWWCSLSNVIGEYRTASHQTGWHENIRVWANDLKKYKGSSIVGSLFNTISDFEKAIEYFTKSLEIAREIGDNSGQSECYKGLGDVYQNLGRERERIECYAKSIEITRDIGDEIEKSGYVNRDNRLVDIRQDERTLALCRDFKRINEMMQEHKESIEKDDADETFRKAIKKLEVVLEMVKKQGDRKLEASAYISLGENYYMLGSYKKAIEYYEMARGIAVDTGAKYTESDSYLCLCKAYQSLGDMQTAKEWHDKNMRLNEQLGTRETLREV